MVQQGWSRPYVNHQVNRVRRAFRWGVENELAPASVLHGLQAVAPLKRGRTEAPEPLPVKPVPDEHVDAVVPHVSRQVAAMIELQLLSGARPGEIVRLRPCDVDRSATVWVYRPSRHKTQYRGQEREIYLGPKAQDVLRPWLLRAAEAYCFSPAEAEKERNATRRTKRKTPMTPSQAKRRPTQNPKRPKRDRFSVAAYRRAIEYAIKKAGVPHWHPHQLRHNCATRVRRAYGLDVAQVIFGQQELSSTQVYAEADRARALTVMAQTGWPPTQAAFVPHLPLRHSHYSVADSARGRADDQRYVSRSACCASSSVARNPGRNCQFARPGCTRRGMFDRRHVFHPVVRS